jgi:hypothetical protein
MLQQRGLCYPVFCNLVLSCVTPAGLGGEVNLLSKPHDPYGVPRPGPGQEHVPLRTSFYLELGLSEAGSADAVLAESVSIELEPEGAAPFAILKPNGQFATGYTGRLLPGKGLRGSGTLIVYVEAERQLRPATRYTIRVNARSREGAALPAKAGEWRFTTEAEPATHQLSFKLPLETPAVRWHGGFFTGFCGTSFCTSHAYRIPTYELMEQVRKTAPKAWSLQRDFWMTGMEHRPELLARNLPNIVRERETRRIVTIDKKPEGSLLHVEDFFGHQQYGIASDRPVSEDYHPGDEVLVADGLHDARAKVVAVDDRERTVLVTGLDTPAGGWKLEYAAALPATEDPNAPGLFAPGGCYLRKFRPSGTPVYYWGRLDREWDLAHQRFKRRLLPNFADAPGDLALDGRSWTTAKDYVELHEATRAITSHIIKRYGAAALDFPWSVFNEPDLGKLFWRSDWNELQKFYDYTVDGILRAFEDHGYDSRRVFVGGLELGGIFGTNLRLREFLAHCSPRARAPGALPLNAAFADARLNGKRSKRVEDLCRAHAGRGSPCDFISIHAYNRSKVMADKLARAKEMALEIDADYYAQLWINSHESCPGWNLPPDPAYADSYLGNGYFPTWCADVARRQLQRAAGDARYALGESILTFWPWPNTNFGGGNDCVRLLHVDEDGNGTADRSVTVAMPILHFLGLLAGMGSDYQVLPEQVVGGHVVSGFASQAGESVRVVLYAHHALDTESRSEAAFDVTLDLSGLKGRRVLVHEYRFDKDHNSYFRLGRELRDQPATGRALDAAQSGQLRDAHRELESDQPATQLAALDKLAKLGPAAASAAGAIFQLLQKSDATKVREKATATLKLITAPRAYPAAVMRRIEEQAALRRTGSANHAVGSDGHLQVRVRVAGNGANYLILVPAGTPD